jgi:hypothetical protein
MVYRRVEKQPRINDMPVPSAIGAHLSNGEPIHGNVYKEEQRF